MPQKSSPPLDLASHELASLLRHNGNQVDLPRFVSQMRQFVDALEQNPQAAPRALEEFEGQLDSPIFREVGHILRQFHNRMIQLQNELPAYLTAPATSELGTVAEKLKHVLEMTGKAANETLDLTELIEQRVEARMAGYKELRSHLEETLAAKQNNKKAVKRLVELQSWLDRVEGEDRATLGNLTQLHMAQSYHDLTGQLIQKVLPIVGDLETRLVGLIERFGHRPQTAAQRGNANAPQTLGPLPESDQQRQNQGNVDSLLSQFGF